MRRLPTPQTIRLNLIHTERRPAMWVMYDSIDLDQIPAHAQAVAGYVDGHWPTWQDLQHRWPHAHQLSITVTPGQDADCLDVENGDAQPRDVPNWIRRQHARGITPVIYADLSTYPAIHIAIAAARIPRTGYLEWTAHYTNEPHITPGADATQWTNHALDRDLDESLCTDTFLTTPAKPRDRALTAHELAELTGLAQQTEHIIDRLLALNS
jgi:hypothetical protein